MSSDRPTTDACPTAGQGEAVESEALEIVGEPELVRLSESIAAGEGGAELLGPVPVLG